jgi:spore coat protein U-like protein
MKNHRRSFKIIAATLFACSAGMAAADTQTLAVSANVSGNCKFSAGSTPLAFGAINPASTSDVTATARVLYRCTKNTVSLGITGTAGPHAMTTPGGDTLPYSLGITGASGAGTGLGFGAGSDLTAAVTGTITAANFQNAAAGVYTENVTLTITP